MMSGTTRVVSDIAKSCSMTLSDEERERNYSKLMKVHIHVTLTDTGNGAAESGAELAWV